MLGLLLLNGSINVVTKSFQTIKCFHAVMLPTLLRLLVTPYFQLIQYVVYVKHISVVCKSDFCNYFWNVHNYTLLSITGIAFCAFSLKHFQSIKEEPPLQDSSSRWNLSSFLFGLLDLFENIIADDHITPQQRQVFLLPVLLTALVLSRRFEIHA